MESEIKLAWIQGAVAAMLTFTAFSPTEAWELAKDLWKEPGMPGSDGWNRARIAHRDGSNDE